VDYFGEYHGIAMSSWVFPQEHANGLKGFGSFTQPILEFYIDHIGPFSYEKMAQVEANTVGGGMELASDIFYGYNGVPGRQLLAHEMAHQYFGNSVSESDWDDVWLSEGFATYFALLYQEYQDGHDAYLDGVQRSAASAIRYAESNPQSTIVHNHLANISQVIANNAQIYQGGAQVLHMLRGVVGTNAFWDGIRLYYSRFQNRNATSDDFRRAMQDACAASPDCPEDGKDLSWYFPQWLNRGGILQLNGSWHYDSAAKELHITLDQTQTQGLFRMPIEVGVSAATAAAGASNAGASRAGGRGTGGAGAGGGRGGRGGAGAPAGPGVPLRIVVDKQHNEFTFPMPSEPADVILDPNHWVSMMQATFVRKKPAVTNSLGVSGPRRDARRREARREIPAGNVGSTLLLQQLPANLSARVGGGMHVHVGIPAFDERDERVTRDTVARRFCQVDGSRRQRPRRHFLDVEGVHGRSGNSHRPDVDVRHCSRATQSLDHNAVLQLGPVDREGGGASAGDGAGRCLLCSGHLGDVGNRGRWTTPGPEDQDRGDDAEDATCHGTCSV
jgi:hypothetical protein